MEEQLKATEINGFNIDGLGNVTISISFGRYGPVRTLTAAEWWLLTGKDTLPDLAAGRVLKMTLNEFDKTLHDAKTAQNAAAQYGYA